MAPNFEKKMTREEVIKMVKRNIQKNPYPTIDTDTGLAAVEKVAKTARTEKIDWALAGGIAMQVYGGDRQTSDVDIIAAKTLSLKAERRLGFGGERYRTKVGKKDVAVDWIVRNDDAKKFYQKALEEAVTVSGVSIITPEWLVILKYVAGRFKDQHDALYLLRKKGLVSRRLIRKKIVEIVGDSGWALIATGLKRWYDLADGKITTEKDDYEAGRV